MKQNRTRTRRTLAQEFLSSFLVLILIIGLAILVTYLIAEPINHPNLHPRLVSLASSIQHYHPRMLKVLYCLPFLAIASAPIARVFAWLYLRTYWRKRRLLSLPARKMDGYLNQSKTEIVPVLLPHAWQRLKDVLPGLTVHGPDLRASHWEIIEKNEDRKEMELGLRYFHDPLAIKPSKLYTRQLRCTARLKGKGTKSEMELMFKAMSAMDYQAVFGIIEQTKMAVAVGLRDETACQATLAT